MGKEGQRAGCPSAKLVILNESLNTVPFFVLADTCFCGTHRHVGDTYFTLGDKCFDPGVSSPGYPAGMLHHTS